MKIALSIKETREVEANTADYTDCNKLDIVCPSCFNPVFKVGAKEDEGARQYFSHYGRDITTEDCELRVGGGQDTEEGRSTNPKDQSLNDRILSFKNFLLNERILWLPYKKQKTSVIDRFGVDGVGRLIENELFKDIANRAIIDLINLDCYTKKKTERHENTKSEIEKVIVSSKKYNSNKENILNHSAIKLKSLLNNINKENMLILILISSINGRNILIKRLMDASELTAKQIHLFVMAINFYDAIINTDPVNSKVDIDNFFGLKYPKDLYRLAIGDVFMFFVLNTIVEISFIEIGNRDI